MNFVAPQFALAAAVLLAAGPAAHAAKPTNPLNDTGANLCVDANYTFTKACTGTGQDGETGRDVTNKGNKDGRVGFSYRHICHSGELAGTGNCPAVPVLGTGPNDWGCTKDKVTKLIWEVKTKTGLRAYTKTYINWGNKQTGDASAFVAAVNQKTLCGAADWRLPTVAELQGIVDYGVAYPGPTINENWFSKTQSNWYWTADGYAGIAGYAWIVDFGNGGVGYYGRYYDGAVRLVRVGQ